MKNYIFLCLMKKDAGPAIIDSIATELSSDNDTSAYFIVSDEIENKPKLDTYASNIHIIYLDTGNKKTFIFKTLKFILSGKKRISDVTGGLQFDLYLQVFGHPWGKMIGKSFKYANDAVICHDPAPHTGESFLNKLLSEYAYKKASNLVVCTRSFVDLAKKRFKKRVYFMPHGLLTNYKWNADIVEKTNKDKNRVRFLFFGRIEKYKGVEILLKAFSRFSEKEQAELVIAGCGDLSAYDQWLKDRRITTINRYLNDSEISDLFSDRNTILVLPYIDATQSGVAMIAIGLEVPVIASDTGGLKEQLNNGNFGYFCRPGDVDDLFEKMSLLYRDKERLEVEREKMRAFKSELRWSCLLEKLTNELNGNISGSRTR